MFSRSRDDSRGHSEGLARDAMRNDLYGRNIRANVQVSASRGYLRDVQPGISVIDQIELVRHTKRSGKWVRVDGDDDEEDEERIYERA
ncbi:hypothetical protein GGR52DRAFT_230198 [Hypoxylon sp. FL1284]|nr:hypothetical protein GGR52DRAFT_230198 [Hypoxylon sp. FL1284]